MHGLTAVIALLFVRQVPPPQPEVFTWKVSLVEMPHMPHGPKEEVPASSKNESPGTDPPVAEAARPPGPAASPARTSSRTLVAETPVPDEPLAAQVRHLDASTIPSAPMNAEQEMNPSLSHARTAEVVPAETAIMPDTSVGSDQDVATTGTQTVLADVSPAAPGVETSPPGSEPAAPSIVPALSAPADQADVPKSTSNDSRTETQRPDIAEGMTDAFMPAPADYRWLAALLRDRIVQLRHYSVEARTNRLEGRVVVRAVVDRAGTIVDATVARSSGHELLDRDALALVRQAGPLDLRESILQPRVVLKVPVSYSLRN